MPAVYVPELRRASSRVLRPYGLASRRRPVDRTVEHADGYTSQTGTQLHISQFADRGTHGTYTSQLHRRRGPYDRIRVDFRPRPRASSVVALRRPLHGTWGAVRAAVGSGRPRVAGSDLELDPVTAPSRSIATAVGSARTTQAALAARAMRPRARAHARSSPETKSRKHARKARAVTTRISKHGRKTHPQIATKQYMQSKNT